MVLENVHYTAYRDHIIGQPILGNRDSIMRINRNDIKQFVDTHYIAPRIIIAGAGNVEHQ
jgi:processing peptidase subunit beta